MSNEHPEFHRPSTNDENNFRTEVSVALAEIHSRYKSINLADVVCNIGLTLGCTIGTLVTDERDREAYFELLAVNYVNGYDTADAGGVRVITKDKAN